MMAKPPISCRHQPEPESDHIEYGDGFVRKLAMKFSQKTCGNDQESTAAAATTNCLLDRTAAGCNHTHANVFIPGACQTNHTNCSDVVLSTSSTTCLHTSPTASNPPAIQTDKLTKTFSDSSTLQLTAQKDLSEDGECRVDTVASARRLFESLSSPATLIGRQHSPAGSESRWTTRPKMWQTSDSEARSSGYSSKSAVTSSSESLTSQTDVCSSSSSSSSPDEFNDNTDTPTDLTSNLLDTASSDIVCVDLSDTDASRNMSDSLCSPNDVTRDEVFLAVNGDDTSDIVKVSQLRTDEQVTTSCNNIEDSSRGCIKDVNPAEMLDEGRECIEDVNPAEMLDEGRECIEDVNPAEMLDESRECIEVVNPAEMLDEGWECIKDVNPAEMLDESRECVKDVNPAEMLDESRECVKDVNPAEMLDEGRECIEVVNPAEMLDEVQDNQLEKCDDDSLKNPQNESVTICFDDLPSNHESLSDVDMSIHNTSTSGIPSDEEDCMPMNWTEAVQSQLSTNEHGEVQTDCSLEGQKSTCVGYLDDRSQFDNNSASVDSVDCGASRSAVNRQLRTDTRRRSAASRPFYCSVIHFGSQPDDVVIETAEDSPRDELPPPLDNRLYVTQSVSLRMVEPRDQAAGERARRRSRFDEEPVIFRDSDEYVVRIRLTDDVDDWYNDSVDLMTSPLRTHLLTPVTRRSQVGLGLFHSP